MDHYNVDTTLICRCISKVLTPFVTVRCHSDTRTS